MKSTIFQTTQYSGQVLDTASGEQEMDGMEEGSSFSQATFNSISAILGISFLTTPYALEKAGLFGLSILFAFALISCYTAYILGHCLVQNPSYNKVAEAAFGRRARVSFTLLVHFEMIAVLVGYTISMGDNLGRLFPHASLKFSTLEIGPSKLLLLLAFVIILPTTWLRDLTLVSYLSLCGIIIYTVIAVTILYAGIFDRLGFHHSVPLLRPSKLLSITGVYAYCYAAHCAFPSIYVSLRKPSSYPKVLIVSFLLSTAAYTGFAFLGGTMFGQYVLPQVSLNIPIRLTAAKIVLSFTAFLPASKYSLCIAPMALDIESRFQWPKKSKQFLVASILLRTSFMIIIFVLAMALPYFETLVNFIGSASGMLVAVILPSLFYLKIFRRTISKWEFALNVAILTVGIVVGTSGTVVSIVDFVHRK